MIKAIGVDFGTCFLRAVVSNEDDEAPNTKAGLADDFTSEVRGVCCFGDEGEWIYGRRAYSFSLVRSEQCHVEPIRFLGERFDDFSEEEISSDDGAGLQTVRGLGGDVQLRYGEGSASIGLPFIAAGLLHELLNSVGRWQGEADFSWIHNREEKEGEGLSASEERTDEEISEHTDGTDRKDEEDCRTDVDSSSSEDSSEGPIERDSSTIYFSVPSNWGPAKCNALVQASQIAGVRKLKMESKARCIARAYQQRRQKHGTEHESERVLFCDVGAVEAEFLIVDFEASETQIRTVVSMDHIGGHSMDKKIVAWLYDRFRETQGEEWSGDATAFMRMRDAAEKAKQRLSDDESTEIHLPYLWADESGPKHLQTTLERNDFERLIRDQIDGVAAGVDQILAGAQCEAQSIDKIVMLGGSSRIPVLQDRIEEIFSKIPNLDHLEDDLCREGLRIAMEQELYSAGEQSRPIQETVFGALNLVDGSGKSQELFDAKRAIPARAETSLEAGAYELRTIENSSGESDLIARIEIGEDEGGKYEFAYSSVGQIEVRQEGELLFGKLEFPGMLSKVELEEYLQQAQRRELDSLLQEYSDRQRNALGTLCHKIEAFVAQLRLAEEAKVDEERLDASGADSKKEPEASNIDFAKAQMILEGAKQALDESSGQHSIVPNSDALNILQNWVEALPDELAAKFKELTGSSSTNALTLTPVEG